MTNDALKAIKDAIAPLRRGKWVSAALRGLELTMPASAIDRLRSSVEERGNQASDEAVEKTAEYMELQLAQERSARHAREIDLQRATLIDPEAIAERDQLRTQLAETQHALATEQYEHRHTIEQRDGAHAKLAEAERQLEAARITTEFATTAECVALRGALFFAMKPTPSVTQDIDRICKSHGVYVYVRAVEALRAQLVEATAACAAKDRALVQARATLKLADEAPKAFTHEQAEVTFKIIHEALTAASIEGLRRIRERMEQARNIIVAFQGSVNVTAAGVAASIAGQLAGRVRR